MRVIHSWQKAPFTRVLAPFIAGILIQWETQVRPIYWQIGLILSTAVIAGFFVIPFLSRYRYRWFAGINTCIIFISLGAILCWQKDIRHQPQWIGHHYQPGNALVVTLNEPLVEKTKSVKADALFAELLHDKKRIHVKGGLIIYFKKDSSLQEIGYGSRILLKKPIQEIKNAGNPGSFDYRRYCLFRGITHQVYLQPGEFEVLPGKKQSGFRRLIYATREKVLEILRTNMHDEKALGLAQALLIGYKDDLDKTLVQSYTNTGVVHIIAISGLHLGLIYWLLTLLFKPIRRNKKLKWLPPLLITIGLWLFSFLAGAQPSVLRSALMFTCITWGEGLGRKGSVFNTLAISAFILLCIRPYWLWDLGFQLSYAALLSIVLFMKPIYDWFYIKNKLLDHIWKLNAVTIAAQVLTLPLSIYHFHQFPNYFLLTNFVAVPLSSLILLGEILLCCIAAIPWIASVIGDTLVWMIGLMNGWVERVSQLPFPVWEGLQINLAQAILLFLFITGFSYALMEKKKNLLFPALTALLIFFSLRSSQFITADKQRKIIIYNITGKTAIDLVDRRRYLFKGDSGLLADEFANNFHLKPARTFFRTRYAGSIPGMAILRYNCIRFGEKNILLVDTTLNIRPTHEMPVIDLLVISKKAKLSVPRLAASFNIRQVVFDGSVTTWQKRRWKADCDSLRIPLHDVSSQGAFVMNLQLP